jgi:hydrogenase/urease accessory protein HupE
VRGTKFPMPRALPLVLAAALLLWAAPAHAHDETVSTSEVRITNDTVAWRVEVGLTGLAKAGRLPKPEAQVTEQDLQGARDTIGGYLASALTLTLDGQPTPAAITIIEGRREEGALTRVLVELRYRAPKAINTLHARVAFFAELTRQHRAVIVVWWGKAARQLVRLGPTDFDVRRDELAPGWGAVAREFLLWGAEHIFIGYDHIAFLLALLLVARGWTELLKIVTAFTVAHSLTLLLSALDVVRVPSQLTEVLIAASIVYVAAENLWLARRREPQARYRWVLTFLFGLVHGLGFATVLRERLASLAGSVLLPVVSFNLGVELGQLAIVAAAFPLLVALRRSWRPALIIRAGSVPILLLGLGWLIQRLAG